MKRNIRKISKLDLMAYKESAVKHGRLHRFAKWIEETQGIYWRSLYEKLRRGRVKRWEGVGIIRCMDEYGFHGNPDELWNRCVKNRFADFMETKQMSHMTTYRRFGANDFTKLELEGISATYRYWRENLDPKLLKTKE